MLRCDVCDSSEVEDTLAFLGINNPIRNWVKLKSGEHRCNRCHKSIMEVNAEFELAHDKEEVLENEFEVPELELYEDFAVKSNLSVVGFPKTGFNGFDESD